LIGGAVAVDLRPDRQLIGGAKTRFQWRVGGHAISGSTESTYRVRAADVGHRLSVRVTAHVAGHGHTATTSPGTGRVARR